MFLLVPKRWGAVWVSSVITLRHELMKIQITQYTCYFFREGTVRARAILCAFSSPFIIKIEIQIVYENPDVFKW